jgi:hypothetical protein
MQDATCLSSTHLAGWHQEAVHAYSPEHNLLPAPAQAQLPALINAKKIPALQSLLLMTAMVHDTL